MTRCARTILGEPWCDLRAALCVSYSAKRGSSFAFAEPRFASLESYFPPGFSGDIARWAQAHQAKLLDFAGARDAASARVASAN